MNLQQRLTFYVLVPLLPALPLGIYQAGYGKLLSPLGSVALWCATWLISWLGCEIGTRLTAVALKPWRPPLLLLLVAGAVLNTIASSFYHPRIVQLFLDPDLLAGARGISRNFTDLGYLRVLALSGASSLFAWTLANIVLEHVTGITRFADARAGSAPDPTAISPLPVADAPTGANAAATPKPAILDRLERLKGLRAADLQALEAEDHYVKVHAAVGSELVYYRFSDALRDVQELDGVRVHRSFWVSRAAVERVEKNGRHTELLLRGGLRVTVSEGFREIVRAALPAQVADPMLRASIAR